MKSVVPHDIEKITKSTALYYKTSLYGFVNKCHDKICMDNSIYGSSLPRVYIKTYISSV